MKERAALTDERWRQSHRQACAEKDDLKHIVEQKEFKITVSVEALATL